MSSGCRSLWLAAALICALAVACPRPAGAQPAVSVCIDRSSPSAGIDRAVAKAALQATGAGIRSVPFDSGGQGGQGLGPRQYRALAEHRCDLVMGFPVQPKSPAVPAGLHRTAAYLHTGFVLTSRQGWTLDSLPRGSRVGVVYEGPLDLFLADRDDRFRVVVFDTQQGELRALRLGHLDAAATWQLSVRAFGSSHPAARAWKQVRLAIPNARWDLTALYAPRARAAAARFERGLKRAHVGADARDASGAPRRAGAPAGTGVPRLYTKGQSLRGATLFAAHCSRCHGAHLQGLVGPPLKGKAFAAPGSDLTIAEIFATMSQRMPLDDPASLSKSQYADLLAFVLQQNGYPPGDQAMTYADAAASQVPLVFRPQRADVARMQAGRNTNND